MKLDIGGAETIQAPVEVLWKALNDPVVLTRCIPGCKTMTEIAPDAYKVEMQLRVAAVGGSFEGEIALSDKVPPKVCSIKVSGAGTLGHGNGSARFEISSDGAGASRLTFQGVGEIGAPVEDGLDAARFSGARRRHRALSPVVDADGDEQERRSDEHQDVGGTSHPRVVRGRRPAADEAQHALPGTVLHRTLLRVRVDSASRILPDGTVIPGEHRRWRRSRPEAGGHVHPVRVTRAAAPARLLA